MLTIGHIIALLKAGTGTVEHTVDKLEPGDLNTEVKGVVTAFSASHYVIEQAIALGANLVISHEGIYYSHHDKLDMLQDDPVYRQKSKLIAGSELGIYRFHDDVHRYTPDGIMEGLLHALDWQQYVTEHRPAVSILTIPAAAVKEIADHLKSCLELSYVRVAGNLSGSCTRMGVLVGYRGGGATAIPLYEQDALDLIIAGEGPEWETPEYVKDTVQQGRNKALIMLGHAESEAPGMKAVAERLSAQLPGLPIHFVKEQPVFQIV